MIAFWSLWAGRTSSTCDLQHLPRLTMHSCDLAPTDLTMYFCDLAGDTDDRILPRPFLLNFFLLSDLLLLELLNYVS